MVIISNFKIEIKFDGIVALIYNLVLALQINHAACLPCGRQAAL